MTNSREIERMSTTEYLNQPVVYGGLVVTRGEMIADLARIAADSGHPNPQALVDRYLRGFKPTAKVIA